MQKRKLEFTGLRYNKTKQEFISEGYGLFCMKQKLTIEHGLYILALLIGAGLRFTHLGVLPLSDYEARGALAALHIAQGNVPAWASIPAYEMLSGLLIFLFGSNNYVARFLPALVGSLLVLAPLLFRPWLGRQAALICAFGLAFDPGLVAVSRSIGSPLMAVSFSVLALGLWHVKRPFWACATFALALLSGPSVFAGGISLALAAGIGRLLLRKEEEKQSSAPSQGGNEEDEKPPVKALWTFITVALLVFLAVATLLFRFPQGLGIFAHSFLTYFQGWAATPQLDALTLVGMLVLYQPLALGFGLAGALRGWLQGGTFKRWLSIWLGVNLILCLVYPARQPGDLVWLLIPLWGLAASEIACAFQIPVHDITAALGQALLIFVLFALAWINFAGLLIAQPTPEMTRMRWIMIGGVFVLGLLATVLVGMGWSFHSARLGLIWGVFSSLALMVISSAWGVMHVSPFGEGAPDFAYPPAAQWAPMPATGEERMLLHTLGDLAEWHSGNRRILDIVVVSPDPVCDTCLYSPALQWSLRDFHGVRFVDQLRKDDTPSVVITTQYESDLNLTTAYRGQSFAWFVFPEWQAGFGIPADWIRWLLYRNVPAKMEQVILWARSDIFPGASAAADQTLTVPVQEVIPPETNP